MARPSITSTDSFLLRAQRSEERRTLLMAGVWAALLAVVLARRALDGEVMATNAVFAPMALLLLAAVVYELIVYARVRRCNHAGTLFPRWRWNINAAIEVAVPLAGLAVLHYFSPRGQLAALTAPTLLVLPLIVITSVLRLRPRLSLAVGLAAAAGHLTLTLHTLVFAEPPIDHDWIPVLLTYPVLLALCGAAGALVARRVKGYVVAAAEEAAAAEHAKRRLDAVERDMSIAREIQQGLIPQSPPEVEGFDIAGMNRPADSTGGDYFDFQPLPDGRIVVVMADVTGHGIGPALVMAVCRAYARASAPIIREPGLLLERLNALVHADIQGSRFITLAIAVIDPQRSTLELISAGHGPTLLYRAADKSVTHFGGDGIPLGIMPDQQYGAAHSIALAPGDILLLTTDGFFEWQRADGEQFGIGRVEQALREHAGDSAETILARLDERVRAFADGSVQNDDMTAVAIKRRA